MSDHYSDEEAKEILARAIELDARAHTTSADDLRAIASDVGISPAALEAAIRERAARPAQRVATTGPSTTVVAAIGVPLGVGAGALLTLGSAYFGLAGLGLTGFGLVASSALLILHGASATHRSFQLRNFVLWSGIAAGSLVTISLFPVSGNLPVVITLAWCIRSWIASSILGSAAVIAIRKATRTDTPDDNGDVRGSSDQPVASWWVRASKRVRDFFTRTVKRERRHMLPVRLFEERFKLTS